jgi:hypothetical protein
VIPSKNKEGTEINNERLFGKYLCMATLPAKSKLIARDKIYQTRCGLYRSSLFSELD